VIGRHVALRCRAHGGAFDPRCGKLGIDRVARFAGVVNRTNDRIGVGAREMRGVVRTLYATACVTFAPPTPT
jgi:hypothetical protein